MRAVVDASVAVKWLVDEDGRDLARRLLDDAHDLIAPDLVLGEVANAFWTKARKGEINFGQAEQGLVLLPQLFNVAVPVHSLVERALRIARDIDHPAYDCVYLACAEMRDTPCITTDRRFSGKVVGTQFGHRVALLSDTSARL